MTVYNLRGELVDAPETPRTEAEYSVWLIQQELDRIRQAPPGDLIPLKLDLMRLHKCIGTLVFRLPNQ